MAIIQGFTNSFKLEIMQGIHDLRVDSLKMALYDVDATLDLSTTAFTTTDEVVGTGYTTGGEALTNVVLVSDGNSVLLDFDNVEWEFSTLETTGALIYNTAQSNKSIAVLDFGTLQTTSNASFILVMPTPDEQNGLLGLQ